MSQKKRCSTSLVISPKGPHQPQKYFAVFYHFLFTFLKQGSPFRHLKNYIPSNMHLQSPLPILEIFQDTPLRESCTVSWELLSNLHYHYEKQKLLSETKILFITPYKTIITSDCLNVPNESEMQLETIVNLLQQRQMIEKYN